MTDLQDASEVRKAAIVTGSVEMTANDGTGHANSEGEPSSSPAPSPLQAKHPSTIFDETVKEPTAELPASYLAYLESLRAAWPDLPELTITYKDFSHVVRIPTRETDVPNLASSAYAKLRRLNVFRDRTKETKEFRPLNSASGIIRPGEMTLVLAPPGHGKTALLKGLAGRLEREHENLRGEIRWNGLTANESAAAGQQLSKLCAFVEQGDVHFPMLTVRETFAFALKNSNADVTHLNNAELAQMQAKKVELMLELLGLQECADTIVGNALMRGVSGGQKKRVTLGEMMITQARALFLDEISTGLDSAATLDITCSLKKWTRVMRGSAVVALLQPAPEVFAMFDNIILLRDGQVMFHGTCAQLRQHFERIRIEPNEEIDFADWLVEFLTDPIQVWKRDIEQRGRPSGLTSLRQSFRESRSVSAAILPAPIEEGDGHMYPMPAPETPVAPADSPTREPSLAKQVTFHLGEDALDEGIVLPPAVTSTVTPNANGVPTQPTHKRRKGLGHIVTATGIPLTTAALREAYESSSVFTDMLADVKSTEYLLEQQRGTQPKPQPLTRAQYYSAQSHSLMRHTLFNLERQVRILARSKNFLISRLGQAVIMGLIIGSLFYGLGTTEHDYTPRIGLIVFSLQFVAFNNMAEVPLASEFKLVVYKQVDAGFYHTAAYVLSVILMHIPLAIVENIIFVTFIYWMANFSHEVGRFFFYAFTVFMMNLCISCLYRGISYGTRNRNIAFQIVPPVTATCLIFAGFLITQDKIPDWLIWVFYMSPYSWATRSMALNEFHASRYTRAQGDAYLQSFQIRTNNAYKWGGIGYLAGFFLIFALFSGVMLHYKRFWLTVGTRRTDEAAEEIPAGAVTVRLGAKSTSMAELQAAQRAMEEQNRIKFDKMDLCWIDLKYEVTVSELNEATGKKETRQRQLLAGVNGYAKAGELTALMGSSGAGKTTLMDVIAGRKTSGKITGQILVDGRPQQFPAFNRLMGYCQQVDIHVGTDTVREAIEFSAKLRLPSSVSAEERTRFVDQILDDLELTPLENRLVGDSSIEGLSPGELKRVTIGVELAANPTFLFLDEPTSGLDSRAALIVCRVIKKIAQRGRAVVCTIHQPSAELFGQFDRLLLMKKGGKMVYFGPVGENGVDLVEYFMEAPIGEEFHRPHFPERANPASWMLDVIGAGTSAKGKVPKYDEVYKNSDLRKENLQVIEQLAHPREDKSTTDLSRIYASTFSRQFQTVLARFFTAYWRDTGYNLSKMILMVMVGLIFGLVWRDIDDSDEAGLRSKLSAIYLGVAFWGVLHLANALPVVVRFREVFYRERSSNTYSPYAYSAAFGLVELPYLFVCAILYVTPLYFLVHFEYDGQQYFRFVLIFFLMSILYTQMGQLLGSALPDLQIAGLVQGLLFTFFLLFGGVFIQKDAIPRGWQWMYYLLPLQKPHISMSIYQFYCEGPDCPTIDSVQYGQGITKWSYVSQYLSTGKDWERYYLAYILLMIVVVHLAVTFSIAKISFIKR